MPYMDVLNPSAWFGISGEVVDIVKDIKFTMIEVRVISYTLEDKLEETDYSVFFMDVETKCRFINRNLLVGDYVSITGDVRKSTKQQNAMFLVGKMANIRKKLITDKRYRRDVDVSDDRLAY